MNKRSKDHKKKTQMKKKEKKKKENFFFATNPAKMAPQMTMPSPGIQIIRLIGTVSATTKERKKSFPN